MQGSDSRTMEHDDSYPDMGNQRPESAAGPVQSHRSAMVAVEPRGRMATRGNNGGMGAPRRGARWCFGHFLAAHGEEACVWERLGGW